MGEHGEAFFRHRAAGKRQAVLGQVAGGGALDERDVAVVGAFQAGQHLQQRGFAGAVAADQADALAVADDPVEALEEGLGAEMFADGRELNHVCLTSR